jgi:hypothetical protein
MTDRRKLDDPLAAPLAHALAAGLDHSGRDCPNAETLALYFDRAMPTADSARWELHFSACAHCQQQLAAMVRMGTAATAPAAEPRAKGVAWLRDWRWLAPAAAALGALAIWVVVSNVTPRISPAGPEIAQQIEPQASSTPATAPAQEAAADRAPVAGNQQAAAAQPGRGASETPAPVASGKRVPGADPVRPKADERPRRTFTFEATPPKDAPASVGALAGAKKDAPAATPAETLPAKEQQAREAQAKAIGVAEPAAQPPATLRAQQQVAQAPQSARSEEQDLRAARDELKKAPAEPLGPVAETITAEAAPDAAALRRQKSEVAGRFAAAHVAGSKLVWRFGPAGSIERSEDAGATWQRQASGVQGDLLAGSAPSATVCWAVGRGGIVLRTTDGATWAQVGSPASVDLVAIEARDASQATVTTVEGKSYATSDGGRTWRSL